MNAVVSLLSVICALVVAAAFAADPNAGKPDGESLSQASSVATPETVAQSSAATPITTTDPSASGKPNRDAKSDGTATSPVNANAQAVAEKPAKKVLVDDTVTGAQLKQILAKGYRPDKQAPGNEVYYCRSEQLSGDRFETKVCKTATRILEDERRGRELINSVEQIGLQTGR